MPRRPDEPPEAARLCAAHRPEAIESMRRGGLRGGPISALMAKRRAEERRTREIIVQGADPRKPEDLLVLLGHAAAMIIRGSTRADARAARIIEIVKVAAQVHERVVEAEKIRALEERAAASPASQG